MGKKSMDAEKMSSDGHGKAAVSNQKKPDSTKAIEALIDNGFIVDNIRRDRKGRMWVRLGHVPLCLKK
jgi:hypothetical protein